MNILAVAFAIKPYDGSEYAVGWIWVNEIAKIADHVTVLVRDAEGQREAIEEYYRKYPVKNVDFLFYELPGCLKNIVKGEMHTKQTGMRRYYLVWQFFSLFFLRKNLDLASIDIIHHITFPSDWLPSFYGLLGIKNFVLGPLGSNNYFPRVLRYPRSLIIKFYFFYIIKKMFRWFNPLFRYNMIKAKALIGVSPDTRNKLGSRLLSKKFYSIPGVSAPADLKPDPDHFPKTLKAGEEVIIFSACPFIEWKNFDLTIEAFGEYLKINPNARFLLAGDGHLKQQLLDLTHRLKLEGKVEFLGWITMEQVFEIMKKKAHVFLFPTSEFGGTVSLEALRCGLPVICLEGRGYNFFNNQSKGSVAVPIKSRPQVIKDIAAAIDAILKDLPVYSRNAFKESDMFIPETKRILLNRIYTSLMEK